MKTEIVEEVSNFFSVKMWFQRRNDTTKGWIVGLILILVSMSEIIFHVIYWMVILFIIMNRKPILYKISQQEGKKRIYLRFLAHVFLVIFILIGITLTLDDVTYSAG